MILCWMQDAYEKWEEKRIENCDTCNGSKRTKHEKVDLSTFRREEDFAEFFDEGSVMPIAEFLSSKGIDPTKFATESKQRRFVEEEPQPPHKKCFSLFCVFRFPLSISMSLISIHNSKSSDFC